MPLDVLIDELVPYLDPDTFYSKETEKMIVEHLQKVKEDLEI